MSTKKKIMLALVSMTKNPEYIAREHIDMLVKWVESIIDAGMKWSIKKEEGELATLFTICADGEQVDGFYAIEEGSYA